MATYAKYKDLDKTKTPESEDSGTPECMQITSASHKQDLINTHKIVVVDISASWCAPCVQIAPKYAQLAMQYSRDSECAIVKEDVDDGFSPDVTSVPCFDFYYNGQKVERVNGADMNKVRETLEELRKR